jgi:soluble lytic murein transglycosylase-like protein
MASLLSGIPYPQAPDLGGSFLQGQQDVRASQQQSLDLKQNQQASAARTAEIMGRFAVDADTPEKWSAAMQTAGQLGVPDAAQYAGKFNMRDQIIKATQTVSDQLNSRTAGSFLSSLPQKGQMGGGPVGATLSPGYLASLSGPQPQGAAPPVGGAIPSRPDAPVGNVGGDTFGRMIGAESNGNQFAANGQPLTSSAGAVGVAQVMPGTAPEAAQLAGMPFDENRFRTDPAYNKALGQAYFQKQLQDFGGDPALAAAAYNAGPQTVQDFLAGKRMLPAETIAYVQKVTGRDLSGGAGGLGGQVRPATRDIQGPNNNGVPLSSLQILAQNPTYAGTAIQTGIAQNVPIKDRYSVVGNAVFDKLTGNIVSSDPTLMRPTGDMQEYQQNVRQGYSGSFMDYQLAMKRAGTPSTETTYDQTTGKANAETNQAIQQGAQKARNTLATVNAMSAALADPSVTQGSFGNASLAVKRNAQAMGFDVGNLGPAELAQSLGNQLALTLRDPSQGGGMPGAMSDADRAFLQASVPGLSQTPQGNATLLDYMRRVAQRTVDVDTLRQQYIQQHGRLDEGFNTALSQWSSSHPLFSQDEMRTTPQQGAVASARDPSKLPAISNNDEYNSLPSGAEYIAPDGSHRRKK